MASNSNCNTNREVIVWEWLNDYFRWNPYPSHIADYIERRCKDTKLAYLKDIDAEYSLYHVNFINNKQVRELGGATVSTRDIRRKLYPHTSLPARGIQWQWESDNRRKWHLFDLEIAQLLERSFNQNKQDVIDISAYPYSVPYTINLGAMTQTRLGTGRSRPIRRLVNAVKYPMEHEQKPVHVTTEVSVKTELSDQTVAIESEKFNGSITSDIVIEASSSVPGTSVTVTNKTKNKLHDVTEIVTTYSVNNAQECSTSCSIKTKKQKKPRVTTKCAVKKDSGSSGILSPNDQQAEASTRAGTVCNNNDMETVDGDGDDRTIPLSTNVVVNKTSPLNISVQKVHGAINITDEPCKENSPESNIQTNIQIQQVKIKAECDYGDYIVHNDEAIAAITADNGGSDTETVCLPPVTRSRIKIEPSVEMIGADVTTYQRDGLLNETTAANVENKSSTLSDSWEAVASIPELNDVTSSGTEGGIVTRFRKNRRPVMKTEPGKRQRKPEKLLSKTKEVKASVVNKRFEDRIELVQGKVFRIKNNVATSNKKIKGNDVVTLLDDYTDTVLEPNLNQDCSICRSSLRELSVYETDTTPRGSVKFVKCGHSYHGACLHQLYISLNSTGYIVCGECKEIYGEKRGACPSGVMQVEVLDHCLAGYPECDSICVMYYIKHGKQGKEHPNPGCAFTAVAFPRIGYLPNNEVGRKVLLMLVVAWKRRLTFTIGTSTTSGIDDTVTWNDIHHKTESSTSGSHGYPDPNYLDNVTQELSAHGIGPEDIQSLSIEDFV